MHRIAALVPMRHSSERVPGKNYRLLGGRPLYHHIVSTLLATPRVDLVVIDTDSPDIKEDAARSFPQVQVLDRPEHLRAGTVPMNDVLRHDISQVHADAYIQTHSTNPLLRAETVSAAIERFEADDEFDSLFGVTRIHTRLWTDDGRPLNHDPSVLLRTQDLPPVFEENSCLYLFTRDLVERTGNRIGDRPAMFEVPREESWDIDDEVDWEVVEALVEWRRRR